MMYTTVCQLRGREAEGGGKMEVIPRHMENDPDKDRLMWLERGQDEIMIRIPDRNTGQTCFPGEGEAGWHPGF